MAKFTPIMIGLMLSAAFSFCLIYGGILLQVQNNAPILITGDNATNDFYTQINETLYDSLSNNAIASAAFENSSIQTSGANVFISAVGGIWKVMKVAPVAVYNLVITYGFAKLVGNEAAFAIVSVIAGIFAIILISAAVYYITRGEGG